MSDAIEMPGPGSLEERFERFHSLNPHVFESLRDLALEMKANGHVHGGISMLYEVARWQLTFRTTDPDFKLNNNYKPLYARKLMAEVSGLEGFFLLRERPTAA